MHDLIAEGVARHLIGMRGAYLSYELHRSLLYRGIRVEAGLIKCPRRGVLQREAVTDLFRCRVCRGARGNLGRMITAGWGCRTAAGTTGDAARYQCAPER